MPAGTIQVADALYRKVTRMGEIDRALDNKHLYPDQQVALLDLWWALEHAQTPAAIEAELARQGATLIVPPHTTSRQCARKDLSDGV